MAGIGRLQPDAPRLPKTPLELLEPRPDYVEPLLSKYGITGLCGFIGAFGWGLANKMSSRPIHSGIYVYPLVTVGFAYAGYQLQQYRERQWAEKDAILRHYVQLHPDDFPPYKQTTYGEIFESWTPLR